MKSFLSVCAVLLTLAGPGRAQEAGDDWDFQVDPTTQLTTASLIFDNGLLVAVRCVGSRYDALLAGLPAAPEDAETRELSIQFRDAEAGTQRWSVGINPQVAVSDLPARFARELREGGRLQVVVPGGGTGGANVRYVLDLPTSSSAIDQTLQACEKPLVDPRDAEIDSLDDEGLPGGVTWAERPRPEYPSGRTYVRGFAAISCLTQADGRLRDCAVESEHPLDGGFGEAALRGVRRARVRATEATDGPLPTRFIIFRTVFRMNESDPRRAGSRMRGN